MPAGREASDTGPAPQQARSPVPPLAQSVVIACLRGPLEGAVTRMKSYKIGKLRIHEVDDLEEAKALADAILAEKQFWLQVVEAELKGWISQN